MNAYGLHQLIDRRQRLLQAEKSALGAVDGKTLWHETEAVYKAAIGPDRVLTLAQIRAEISACDAALRDLQGR